MNKLSTAENNRLVTKAMGPLTSLFLLFLPIPVGITTYANTGSEVLAWIVAIAVPISIGALLIKRLEKKANALMEKLVKKSVAALKHGDYFYNTSKSAIALDVQNKQLSMNVFKTLNDKEAKHYIFTLDQIEKLGIVSEDYTEFQSFGTGIHAAIQENQVRLVNEANAAKAQLKTGLHIVVSDIMVAEVIVPMETEVARKWVYLLEKLRDDKLERQSTLTLYPPQN